MPELPEVETIRRDLDSLIVGRKIIDTEIILPKILRGGAPSRFNTRLKGRRFTGVGRRAKILILSLDSGECLLVHFKMSGRLVYVPGQTLRERHTHLKFILDNNHELRFIDTRQFGYVKLVEGGGLDDVPEIRTLGPEPLESSFLESDFIKQVEDRIKSRRSLKGLLIDQKFIAGIGNIYADEILHSARIHPERLLSSLTPAELTGLYVAIRSVLNQAIKMRGTTFDRYVDAKGRPGKYFEELQVYGRADKDCFRCGTILRKERIASRGTTFCPGCQD